MFLCVVSGNTADLSMFPLETLFWMEYNIAARLKNMMSADQIPNLTV